MTRRQCLERYSSGGPQGDHVPSGVRVMLQRGHHVSQLVNLVISQYQSGGRLHKPETTPAMVRLQFSVHATMNGRNAQSFLSFEGADGCSHYFIAPGRHSQHRVRCGHVGVLYITARPHARISTITIRRMQHVFIQRELVGVLLFHNPVREPPNISLETGEGVPTILYMYTFSAVVLIYLALFIIATPDHLSPNSNEHVVIWVIKISLTIITHTVHATYIHVLSPMQNTRQWNRFKGWRAENPGFNSVRVRYHPHLTPIHRTELSVAICPRLPPIGAQFP